MSVITGVNANAINATHNNDTKNKGGKTQDSTKSQSVVQSKSADKAQRIKDQIAQDKYEIDIPATSKKMALDLLNL